jgi:hypothetical protein
MAVIKTKSLTKVFKRIKNRKEGFTRGWVTDGEDHAPSSPS